jgi:hypothetical protein
VHLPGHPGGPGERVAVQVAVGGTGHRDRDPVAQQRARGRQLAGPAGAQEVGRLDGTGEPADQGGRGLALGAQQQGLAGVRVRRARLGVQVVPVIPDGHQAQVVDRGEAGGAGADDDLPGPPADRQEVAVAPGRADVGGERDVVAGAEHPGEGPVDPVDVLAVRHADQAAPPRGQRGGRGVREQQRPVRAGGGTPDGPGSTSLGQVGEEGGRGVVPAPGVLGGGRVPGCALGGGSRGLLLGRRVPRRHRQPEHVGPRAGVPVGEVGAQGSDHGTQDGLRAHDPTQEGEPARVVGLGSAPDHEAVDVLAGEAHLHPGSRSRRLGHGRRNGVVEGPVEVGERDVDEHARHRVDRGDLGLGRLLRPGGPGLGLGRLHGRPDHPRQQLWLLVRVGHGQMSISGRRPFRDGCGAAPVHQ